MADEESNEVYGKLKDYPQLIKGVEDDSKVLMETQNKVITEQFGSMRNKITESLNNLHLGVIRKTVDTVVQDVLNDDLKKINDSINAQFILKFNSLLGNLIENVDELMSVGKILDAIEKVNEYVENFNFDDALALLELTMALIKQSDLAEQKQKLEERRVEVLELRKEYDKNLEKLKELEAKLKELQEKSILINEIVEICEEIIRLAPLVGKNELIKKYVPILKSTKKEYDKDLQRLKYLEEMLKEYDSKSLLVRVIETCKEILRLAPLVGLIELREKYSPVLKKAQENYNEALQKIRALEEDVELYREKHLLNDILRACEQIVISAHLIEDEELTKKYGPIIDKTLETLEEIKKETLIVNENFDLLVKSSKVVEAHGIVNEFKKRWVLIIKNPPNPLLEELLSKDEEVWREFVKRQEDITNELAKLEIEINIDVSKDGFSEADIKWETAEELLKELYDKDLKNKWEEYRTIYRIKKKAVETIDECSELLLIFDFEKALTLVNVAIDLVIERNLLDYETRLKVKKDEVYSAQARYDYLLEKIKKHEKKFNENYYKSNFEVSYSYFKNHYKAALNHAVKIVEIASEIDQKEYVDIYTKFKEEIEDKLEKAEEKRLRDLEELERNRKEVEELLEIDENVLPLLSKFSVDDVLEDISGDVSEMLDQVTSLLDANRVTVKKEVANKSVLKTASGEVIESEKDLTIQKLGEEDKESIFYNVQSTVINTYGDTIEEALLTDLIPYSFEITNVEINGKPVKELPGTTLTEDGLEVRWELENIPPKEKLEIKYDLRRRISRTIVFVLEEELKIIKTHSSLNKLQMEGFYDADIPFKNSYGKVLKGLIIEDIIPLYYLHIIKEPTNLLPTEVSESKHGELIKWELGDFKPQSINYQYRLLELYRFEEIKVKVNAMNNAFMDLLEKNELAKAVEKYHEIGSQLEEYHTHD